MKSNITTAVWIIIFLLTGAMKAISQQPTKEEIEEMKKAMREMKADPEMQKAMKQFGIDPNTIENAVNGVDQNGLGSFYEFDEFQVPEKNMARISTIPKKSLTNTTIKLYISAIQKSIETTISSDERKIVELLSGKAKSRPDTLANIASALWVTGNFVPATLIMGQACLVKPNVTNLNNYSAFLVMNGAEELALPILNKLNRENPNNATILNNIGQAWFGLGDLEKAKIYLDSTTMIFATHSQANQTKCVIQENKGDKTGAIQSMKQSVKGAYTPQKEAMLRKLGYKVEGKDLSNSALHMPSDPLGFAKWMEIIPPFPKSYKDQMLLAERWKVFYQEILDEQTKLQERAGRLNIQYSDSLIKRQKRFAANPYSNQFKEPYLSARASKVLKYYTDDKDGHNAAKAKMLTNERIFTYDNIETAKQNAYKKYEQLKRKYLDEIGEGKEAPPGDMCKDVIATYNTYVKSANTELEAYTNNYLRFKASILGANAYFTQYITDLQPLIDFTENNMKLAFLVELRNIKPLLDYQSEFAWGCIETELKEDHQEKFKLADWNDLHCDKKITFSVPYTGSFEFTCNSTSVNLDPLLLPIQVKFKKDLDTDKFINASASVGYGPVKAGGGYDFVKEKGKAFVEVKGKVINEKVGGTQINAGVSGKATFEFDKNGLSGFEMEASGEVKVGNDAVKVSGDANVNWSWEAGGSGEAKGNIDSKALNTAIKAVNLIK